MFQRLRFRINSTPLYNRLGWLVILLGIVLRLREYITDRSLWADEASLALNIVDRNFAGLIQPLSHEQAAPVGFLFVEKSVLLMLGNEDFILRLFPLISGLLSIYLLYRICTEYFGIAALFALSFFSISWPLIYYSSELKQYSSDVLFSTGLIYLSLRALRNEARRRDFFILGLAGAISIWMSHPSMFILATIGFALAIKSLLRKTYSSLAWILGIGILWMASFGLFYLVSLRSLTHNSYLLNYWRVYFMPWPPWQNWNWFSSIYLQLLAYTTHIGSVPKWYFALMSSLLLLVGMIWLFISKRKSTDSLLVFPFVLVLIAAAFQKYPFGDRLILFLFPLLFLLMAMGLEGIYLLAVRWNQIAATIICGVVILVTLWQPASISWSYFISPDMGEDIKPALVFISQHDQPADVIYVYYGSGTAFDYYAPSFNFSQEKVVFGIASRSDPTKYVGDIAQLKGSQRVWLVFSHVCPTCTINELDFYVQHLNEIGAQKEQLKFPQTWLFLYDLSH